MKSVKTDEGKTCTLCGEFKLFSEYSKRMKGIRYLLKSQCRVCETERVLAYSRIPENQDKNRARHLKRIYGITLDQYQTMLEDQNYNCAICQKKCSSGRRLAVDHDPTKSIGDAGFVRGLLCWLCNAGIGRFNHDVDILGRAIRYLNADLDVGIW